jgi:hypothetical protein
MAEVKTPFTRYLFRRKAVSLTVIRLRFSDQIAFLRIMQSSNNLITSLKSWEEILARHKIENMPWVIPEMRGD